MSDSIIQSTQTNKEVLTPYNTDGLELFFTSNRKVRASQSAIARMCKCDESTIRRDLKELGEKGVELDVVHAQAHTQTGGSVSALHGAKTIKHILKKRNPSLLEQFLDFGIDEGLAQMAGVPIISPEPTKPTLDLAEVAQAYLDERKQRMALEAQIEADSEATALGEFLNKGEGLIGMGEMARILEVGRNRLFIELREMGIMMKGKIVPYQWCHEAGYFKLTETLDNNGEIVMVTLITPKGQKYLAKRHKKFLANEGMVVRVERELNLA